MNPEHHRLLLFEEGKDDDFSDIETKDQGASPSPSRPQAQKWPANFALIQVVLIVVYTVTSLAAASLYIKVALSSQTSIQGLSIENTLLVFHNLTNNPYAGRPNDNVEAAWSDLMAPMHIRVTEHELALENQESVALPEGGGYLGWLGAFHELHCIVSYLFIYFRFHGRGSERNESRWQGLNMAQDMLRRWNYRSYYHPNVSDVEEEHMLSHVGMDAAHL
ncbi:hypothetical protein MMC22_000937 [Lobaria immixta]|nr:hypothetical protein [Lobaria immixta]